ncbi:hypothetical protein U7230_07350 [Carboxydochorda subterranea]|uniref:Uncharacterized protein n=1 Tax=Carboxydichorda subterranea TaxID=3109565 RepID=A0ABZ1C1H4_9FIRM|nr:hypothetical protein [Limnochorda sp. L945t]WRP18799.1 hypothetical protein U7230_07350 [Limnochorda sp. L945t]
MATTYYLHKGLDGKRRDSERTVRDVLALKPHFSAADVRGALGELARLEEAARGGVR